MYPVLPLLAFGLILHILRKSRPDGSLRGALLTASILWGVLTVATTEFLSLLNALTPRTLTLCWGLGVVGAALLAVGHRSRSGSSVRRPFKRPSTASLMVGAPIVAVVLVTGFIAILAWPNQWDTMVYHLSRIDHWAQNSSVAFYPTHVVRQLFNPPWAEYAITHVTLLGEHERFTNLVQWFSMVGSMAGVSLIAQHLGAGSRGQLFSALFCATIPMGILQASSSQNDYATAFWLVCLTESVLAPPRDPSSSTRALKIGASLGLALLTKGTAYLFAGPFLAMSLVGRRLPLSTLLRTGGIIVLVALTLNTPHYLRNIDTFGFPLGPRNLGSATEVDDNLANEAISIRILLSNLVRNVALHVGIPHPRFNRAVEKVIERGHILLGIDVNDPRSTRLYDEDRFRINGSTNNPSRTGNPLHLLVLLTVVPAAVFWRSARDKEIVRSYVIALVLSFVLFSLFLKWQPWHSRLHLPLFVLGSPIVGLAYGHRVKLRAAVALLLIVGAWSPLMENHLHPLLGKWSLLHSSRLDQYFIERPGVGAEYIGASNFLRSQGCFEVGLLMGWDDFEHPLWVLLPELSTAPGRLEHVGVTNSSASLKSRRPAFYPCAVVAVTHPVAERTHIEGRSYRRAWSSGDMRVLLVEEERLQ